MFYVKIKNPSPTISEPVLVSETAWRTDRYTVFRLASLTTAQSLARSARASCLVQGPMSRRHSTAGGSSGTPVPSVAPIAIGP